MFPVHILQTTPIQMDLLAAIAEFVIWVAVGFTFVSVGILLVKIILAIGIVSWLLAKVALLQPGETNFDFMTGVDEISIANGMAEMANSFYLPLIFTYVPSTIGFAVGALFAVIEM